MSDERDIVERLRLADSRLPVGEFALDAAAEIARLRSELDRLTLHWTDKMPTEPGDGIVLSKIRGWPDSTAMIHNHAITVQKGYVYCHIPGPIAEPTDP